MKHTGRSLRTLSPLALGGALVALFPACSSDEVVGLPTDGGTEAAAGGAGTGGRAVTGGSAGKATGGGAGTGTGGVGGVGTGGGAGTGTGGGAGTGTGGAGAGGTPATGGYTGTGGTPTTDGGTPDGSPDSGAVDSGPGPEDVLCASDAATAHPLLVGGTKFCQTCSSSELAAVDLATGCVLGRSTFNDSDVGVRASGGRGFVVERTNGALDVLTAKGGVSARIDLHGADGGGAYLNPHDVVFAHPFGGAAKAYVSLYNGSAIAVVDLDTGRLKTTIDLSAFVDSSDSDGSADPDVGFYDAAAERAYFVLQRTDVNTGFVPPYMIACPPAPSLLIAINTVTDTLAVLNSSSPGVGIELGLVAPADVVVDETGRRALFVANGCGSPVDGGATRILGGVESVNLDTLATAVLYAPSTQDFSSRIVLLGSDSALFQSFDDNFTTLWNQWAPSSTTLGASLAGVPELAVAEGADSVVGVVFTGGRPAVTRYEVSTQTATPVVGFPWVGGFNATAGVALVK